MALPQTHLRGLIVKIALFYALLSLPALILVESTVLIFEFEQFMGGIEGGALIHATERAATELEQRWPDHGGESRRELDTWTESWVLRMERPNQALSLAESYVLLELSADPLTAAVLAPDGHVLAMAPEHAGWAPALPAPGDPSLAEAVAARKAVNLPGQDSPDTVRRVLAPVVNDRQQVVALVFVELRLPVPWRRYLLNLSVEWPVIIAYLVVFGLASAIFLTALVIRRLRRMARAATAWSRGDFADRIGDDSGDELGRLSMVLDRMALELQNLLRSRTQLAALAERQRLARDLHDTVKQKAFALNLQLATARRLLGEEPMAQRLDQAQRLTRQIQQDLAQILDELRPADAELPFSDRLRARAAEWAHDNGFDLDIELDEIPPLSGQHEESLLRIVDEALANVLRHSGAGRVAISLRQHDEQARLEVVDNGHWRSRDEPGGRGLGNMRARAASLPAGRFELDTGQGNGTRVIVSFNLGNNASA